MDKNVLCQWNLTPWDFLKLDISKIYTNAEIRKAWISIQREVNAGNIDKETLGMINFSKTILMDGALRRAFKRLNGRTGWSNVSKVIKRRAREESSIKEGGHLVIIDLEEEEIEQLQNELKECKSENKVLLQKLHQLETNIASANSIANLEEKELLQDILNDEERLRAEVAKLKKEFEEKIADVKKREVILDSRAAELELKEMGLVNFRAAITRPLNFRCEQIGTTSVSKRKAESMGESVNEGDRKRVKTAGLAKPLLRRFNSASF